MDIKKTLAFRFAGIVALILTISTLSIYLLFYRSRTEEFYGRLRSKAELVAQMLIDIDAIDMELLRTIERRNPINLPKECIVICNHADEVIYNSEDSNKVIIPNTPLLNRIRRQKEVRYVKDEFEIIGIIYSNKNEQVVVLAAAVDVYGHNKLYMLRNILLVVLFVCLLVVYFAGYFFATRALSPIVNIIEKINKIEVSNLSARLDDRKNKDELASLIDTFNKLLARIQEAFAIQKNFIANASHEMRVPLTVISGQVEVVLMNPRSADEYQQTLESILEDMRNLNNLSNRLLLLAQTSSDFAKMDFSPVRVDDILWQAHTELLKHHKDYNIVITFAENITDEQQLTVLGSDLLLKTAIYNLMDNACKYSENKSAEVELSMNKKNLQLIFKDKGIGIPLKDQPHVFQPFYRAGNSFGQRGHGLGLSLVGRIVELHKGAISFVSVENQGTTFVLLLPLL